MEYNCYKMRVTLYNNWKFYEIKGTIRNDVWPIWVSNTQHFTLTLLFHTFSQSLHEKALSRFHETFIVMVAFHGFSHPAQCRSPGISTVNNPHPSQPPISELSSLPGERSGTLNQPALPLPQEGVGPVGPWETGRNIYRGLLTDVRKSGYKWLKHEEQVPRSCCGNPSRNKVSKVSG